MVQSYKSNLNLWFYNMMRNSSACMKFAWGYDGKHSLNLYNKCLLNSNSHLEIGVASVTDLVNCNIINEKKENIKLSLSDYDQIPLELAEKTLIKSGFQKSNIETICCDALQLNANEFNFQPYNTIALGFVLHVIPGLMNEKFPKIINNLSSLIDKNTILFGSTLCNIYILPEHQDLYTKMLMKQVGKHDNPQDVENVLKNYFDELHVTHIGSVIQFEATNFK
eukprot:275333_1